MRYAMIFATAIALSSLIASEAQADSLSLFGAILQGTLDLTTGQPNQSCGSATAPNTPGNSVSAPGSAFNPNGTAGGVYAGQQPQNSNNPNAASQYDVACFQVSQH